MSTTKKQEKVTPAYREEKLLSNIAGEDYEITPATRKEKLLSEIQGFISEIQGLVEEIQGLPDTTGAQEGDVLAIGSDGPEWAEAGGESNVYIVGGTFYDDGVTPSTLNKTISEISAALADGKCVIVQQSVYDATDPTTIYYDASYPSIVYNDRNSRYEVHVTLGGVELVFASAAVDGVLTEVLT